MNHLSIAAFLGKTALATVSATLAGCFYFAPINDRPNAQIEKATPGVPVRGQLVWFIATGSSDANGDELIVDWSAQACGLVAASCEATPIAGGVGRPLGEPFGIEVPYRLSSSSAPAQGIHITATVTDIHGAFHSTELFVDIANVAPTLELQVQGFVSANSTEVPVGTSVRVVAAGLDPDCDEVSANCMPLTYEWQYFAPSESQQGAVGWEPVDLITYQLTPDVDGPWEVRVTATDELGAQVSANTTINVEEDQPPCIDVTDPAILPDDAPERRYILDRDQGPRRLAVLSVADDLDVYPPPDADEAPLGSARFRWFLATPDSEGVFVPVANHTVADYLVDPGAFVPGDVLSVRVEVADRVSRDLMCGDENPFCSISSNGCWQRITWDMEVR